MNEKIDTIYGNLPLEENNLNDKNIYDLSVKLYVPETIFINKIGNRWLLFAPDYPGLPIVIDKNVFTLLKKFKEGRIVGEVLAEGGDLTKLINYVAFLEEKGFLRSFETKMPYPVPADGSKYPKSFSIWLHITNQCNLACSYCFVGKKSNEVMSNKILENVVEAINKTSDLHEIREIGIKFAGGEPTLVLPTIEKFQYIARRLIGSNVAINMAILSNGTILNNRLISFLKQPRRGISISLDGLGEIHDTYRIFRKSKKGSWGVIKKNIFTLKENGINPFIMSTISQSTCKQLPSLFQWIHENGLRTRLSIVRQPNCSWASENRDYEYEYMCDAYVDAFEKMFAELGDSSIFINMCDELEIAELHFDNPASGAPCGIGQNHIVIKPNGKMVSCPMTISDKGIEIINNDFLLTCRYCFKHKPSERYKLPEDENDECLNCKWYPVCAGGCPITNLRINGHPFSKSPLCKFYKYIIPKYLTFFGKKLYQAEKHINKYNSTNILSRSI